MLKPTIPFSDFSKLEMRVGEIVECEEIEGSEKLLKLTVNLGSEAGKRIILSGIKKDFEPASLIETQVLVLVNLEPKKMMGMESQGMILMAVEIRQLADEGVEGNERFEEEKVTLLIPQNKVSNGTGIE